MSETIRSFLWLFLRSSGCVALAFKSFVSTSSSVWFLLLGWYIGQQKGPVAIVALYDELIAVGKGGIVQVFENVTVFDDFFNEALLGLEMHDDDEIWLISRQKLFCFFGGVDLAATSFSVFSRCKREFGWMDR